MLVPIRTFATCLPRGEKGVSSPNSWRHFQKNIQTFESNLNIAMSESQFSVGILKAIFWQLPVNPLSMFRSMHKSIKDLKSCKIKKGRVNQIGKCLSNCLALFSAADQQNWRTFQTNTKSCCTQAHTRERKAKWEEKDEALHLAQPGQDVSVANDRSVLTIRACLD